jgi:wobble nucleotide-excising tRNase
MISRVQLVRNIGQFDSVDAGAAIALNRYVLVYAENGRGKTTLTAILRSLATGDPVPISERRRLAALNPPHVVLECSVGQGPAVFENGNWNRTFPSMTIFDDRFVNENVYSGLSVEPGHRQKLHELVLGSQGVTLNRRLQELVQRIEEHNVDLRTRAAAIPRTIMGTLSVDEFCQLPALEEIEGQIQQAERSFAAAQEQDSVRSTPGFDPFVLPTFDIAAITRTLERDIPTLDEAAAARVQTHFRELGREGESWVADGMQRIVHTDTGNDICPFCTQDLAQSTIIRHYRAYFGQEYAELKQLISEALTEMNQLHPRELPARFERAVRLATGRRQFWSRFCDVPEVAQDTEPLMREWQASRDGVIAVLEAKQRAPLERMEIPEGVQTAIERFTTRRATVETLNERLQDANSVIGTVKEQAAAGNSEVIAANLARLRATRARHSEEVSALCEEYLMASAAKATTEQLRDQAKDELEQYRTTIFPRYQNAINECLIRFNAGFRIGSVTPVDTRGGPTCNYEVVINNIPIPVAGGIAGPGEPAFRNTLSSGDRNTLALAFFLSSLDQDPWLADKLVVIDDPITSLDEHRSLITVQELRRLGQRVSQLIILSHDKTFLCQFWQGIDKTLCTPIKIERDASGSTIAAWDVSNDSVTEYDRNHAMLRSYLQNGPGHNSRDVGRTLRHVLEGFLRVAYPEHFPPEPLVLARFRRECHQKCGTNAEILNARDCQELDDLVEYANLFHHDTNAAWQTVFINDGQLHAFTVRMLRFATRS